MKYLLTTLNLQFLILVEQQNNLTASNSDALFHRLTNGQSAKKAYASLSVLHSTRALHTGRKKQSCMSQCLKHSINREVHSAVEKPVGTKKIHVSLG